MYRLYMGIEWTHRWSVEYQPLKIQQKLKQYYYFRAEFLEEVWYVIVIMTVKETL